MSVPGLLKWIGNKTRSANIVTACMPAVFNNYYEPFLGSGAVLAELLSQKQKNTKQFNESFASDVLPELIDIFTMVKDSPEVIKEHYCAEADKIRNDKDYYYEIRERFNQRHNALDFLILSRTCYSGIIRFRQEDGYMSTPVGPHQPMINSTFCDRVDIWHHLINSTHFLTQDFTTTMKMAEAGDVVYCDPPYTHSQTIIYGAQMFDINSLWNEIYEAKSRGVYVLLSINGSRNSNAKDISIIPPVGLFERDIPINLGKSMIDRLQQSGNHMDNSDVTDRLMLTWA